MIAGQPHNILRVTDIATKTSPPAGVICKPCETSRTGKDVCRQEEAGPHSSAR